MQLEEAIQLSLALEQSQHAVSRQSEEFKEYTHAPDTQHVDAFGVRRPCRASYCDSVTQTRTTLGSSLTAHSLDKDLREAKS